MNIKKKKCFFFSLVMSEFKKQPSHGLCCSIKSTVQIIVSALLAAAIVSCIQQSRSFFFSEKPKTSTVIYINLAVLPGEDKVKRVTM